MVCVLYWVLFILCVKRESRSLLLCSPPRKIKIGCVMDHQRFPASLWVPPPRGDFPSTTLLFEFIYFFGLVNNIERVMYYFYFVFLGVINFWNFVIISDYVFVRRYDC